MHIQKPPTLAKNESDASQQVTLATTQPQQQHSSGNHKGTNDDPALLHKLSEQDVKLQLLPPPPPCKITIHCQPTICSNEN